MIESLALLSMFAASAPKTMPCPVANEAQVRHAFKRWVRAYEKHDLPGTMAIFAPEVRFEFQGAPDADWKQLQESYARGFARPGRATWVPQWDQIVVSNGLAAAFSKWTAVVTNPQGKPEVRAENRSVDVLRRGADCRWRIIRSLTYPLKAPAAVPAK
jgi:steroid delta-isomerase